MKLADTPHYVQNRFTGDFPDEMVVRVPPFYRQVQSLVGELRFFQLCSMAKIKKERETKRIYHIVQETIFYI